MFEASGSIRGTSVGLEDVDDEALADDLDDYEGLLGLTNDQFIDSNRSSEEAAQIDLDRQLATEIIQFGTATQDALTSKAVLQDPKRHTETEDTKTRESSACRTEFSSLDTFTEGLREEAEACTPAASEGTTGRSIARMEDWIDWQSVTPQQLVKQADTNATRKGKTVIINLSDDMSDQESQSHAKKVSVAGTGKRKASGMGPPKRMASMNCLRQTQAKSTEVQGKESGGRENPGAEDEDVVLIELVDLR